MPTNNETIIAVPLDVTDARELRTFLVKLIVSIDVLAGLRGGNSPLVSKEFLAAELAKLEVTVEPLLAYEQTISATYVQAEMQAMSDAVTALTNKINEVVQ